MDSLCFVIEPLGTIKFAPNVADKRRNRRFKLNHQKMQHKTQFRFFFPALFFPSISLLPPSFSVSPSCSSRTSDALFPVNILATILRMRYDQNAITICRRKIGVKTWYLTLFVSERKEERMRRDVHHPRRKIMPVGRIPKLRFERDEIKVIPDGVEYTDILIMSHCNPRIVNRDSSTRR